MLHGHLPELIVGGGITALTSAAFVYVGVLALGRPVSPRGRLARDLFATWWLGAGLILALTWGHTVLVLLGVEGGSPHVLLLFVRGLLLAVALWALLGYLSYLYLGSYRALAPLGVFYVAFYVFQLWYYIDAGPWVVEVVPWRARVVSTGAAAPILGPWFGVLIGVPVIAAAILYGRLYFRMEDRSSRYRVAVVSSAFAFMFLCVVAAFALGWNREPWFPLAYMLPSLAGALLVVAAYRPPAWVRHRFHVDAFVPSPHARRA